jgi:hypothetical protein
VQIQDSKVESNKALQPNVLESGGGGIYTTPGSLVSLIRSSVSNNTSTRSGGGLVVQGTVTMTEVTISDNNGYGPGGIYNKGTITLNRVTISGNNATNGGLGGGIFNNGTATLTNVTISNNPTGGGFYNVGPASMTNVTVVNNGAIGGVLGRLDTLTLKNTVIAGNDDVNCDTFGGSIVSSGFNLSDDSSCTAYLNMGTDKNNVNALLGPLSFNGSTTQSHLLLHGSPAIDAGTSSGAPTIDQRSNVRPQGLAIDMGATEVCTVKPDKPYLALPGNNSKIKGLQVALDWYDAPCADKYKITVKDAAAGLKVQGGKSGTSDFKTKALTKGKSYLWFVQACNTIGCTKSDTWKFTVK